MTGLHSYTVLTDDCKSSFKLHTMNKTSPIGVLIVIVTKTPQNI